MIRSISIALFVFLLNSVTVYAQMKIDMQKGNKFIVETTTVTTSTAQVMGQAMENNSDSKSTTVYEVLATKPDGFDLQSTLTNMKIAVSVMGQEMNFDSDKKDNKGPLAKELTNSINKAKGVSINTKGEITSKDKSESSNLGMLQPGSTESEIATEIFVPALINKDLKAGDSFPDSSTTKNDKRSSKDSGTYTITAVNNGIASINYTGTQLTTGVMQQMGMEMKTSSKNAVTKELWVDVKTGVVLMQKSTIDGTTDIEAGGMTIPSAVKTITTTNITRSRN